MSDIVDDASAIEQQQRDAALAARQKPVALRHLTDECIDCGEPIPPERRAAIPDAARCAPCQERHERRSGRR